MEMCVAWRSGFGNRLARTSVLFSHDCALGTLFFWPLCQVQACCPIPANASIVCAVICHELVEGQIFRIQLDRRDEVTLRNYPRSVMHKRGSVRSKQEIL